MSDWPVLRTRRRISRRHRINIKSCHATMDHLVWDRRLRDTSGAIVTPLPLVFVFAVSETFILVSVLIKSILLSTSSRSLFYKAQYGLVDGVLWQIIPYCLQDILQLVDGIWLGLKCLVAFKHSSPDMVIKRIKVW